MGSTSSIDAVSSSSSLSDTATTATGGSDLGEDAFLRLLTTQMQYQDPLNPLSNEEFVAQLAQFSSLEELQGISAGLEALYLVDVSMNNVAMVGLLGHTVTAAGDTFHYGGSGDTTLHYEASGDATAATVTITNEDGDVVWSGDIGALAEGEGRWTWDGITLDGSPAPAGDYTFAIEATDAEGNAVGVTPLVQGVVTEMDYSSGTPTPSVGGVPVDIGDILRVDDGSEP